MLLKKLYFIRTCTACVCVCMCAHSLIPKDKGYIFPFLFLWENFQVLMKTPKIYIYLTKYKLICYSLIRNKDYRTWINTLNEWMNYTVLWQHSAIRIENKKKME